jgi:hypothetical protein
MEKILDDTDYKSYMMKELSHLLPPLDFWNKNNFKLDDWQIDIIKKIKNKESILIKAPTSSGKSFIAMSCGILHKKILYICPAKPIVYQVGANFTKLGYKVHYLVENISHLSYSQDTNIFIGTPTIIENCIYKIYTNFDYAIFDEIHNIDNNISYENIIKLLDCNFLALSASISNVEYLMNIFNKIHPKKNIVYYEYTKRFINQQRWVLNNNKLNKLHPIICYDIDDDQSFNDITMTPNDCITLYEKFDDIIDIDDYDILSPDEYFKDDKLLTLDDTKLYEKYLKDKLKILNKDNSNIILKLKDEFTIKDLNLTNNLDDILILFNECKSKDLLPMIYFHTEEDISNEIFMKIYDKLNNEEKYNYPYYYDILKKKDELYKRYKNDRYNYSNSIKIKTNDAHNEKESKLKEFDNTERYKFISNIKKYYEKCIQKSINNDEDNIIIKNLKLELKEFINNPDFREQDIFKKHSKYSFIKGDHMSSDEIRSIRKEIKKTTGLNINYENPIFQLLKRGIGLYNSSMPDEYNWILQKLINKKRLGIVISDRTLCLGIDLPIRTVTLSGYKNPKYNVSDYLQMSGRAGRRGHDNQGNIIFHNVNNYENLMKGTLPEINGSIKKTNNIINLSNINKNINIKNLYWNFNSSIVNDIKNNNLSSKLDKLAWSLRYYDNSLNLLNILNIIEKEIFIKVEEDRIIYLFEKIIDLLFTDFNKEELIEIFLSKKLNNNCSNTIKLLININNVYKDIYNLLDNTYYLIKKYSKMIFYILKDIIYKSKGLEN